MICSYLIKPSMNHKLMFCSMSKSLLSNHTLIYLSIYLLYPCIFLPIFSNNMCSCYIILKIRNYFHFE